MTQHHSTSIKRTFKHLPDIDRGKLQAMHRSDLYTQKEMADILGVNSMLETLSCLEKPVYDLGLNSQPMHIERKNVSSVAVSNNAIPLF
ncbi:hypothetical protein [Halolactibacillus sp. JCM 19043]|uniref:hypothetical protein n=1 Tax=Halolactibacillus sp. JCM 19043 TaxID=1460638 RepID=UPI000785DE16|nr:hypothetical protein [Halolactibacillus sp. JCM 19043]